MQGKQLLMWRKILLLNQRWFTERNAEVGCQITEDGLVEMVWLKQCHWIKSVAYSNWFDSVTLAVANVAVDLFGYKHQDSNVRRNQRRLTEGGKYGQIWKGVKPGE